MPQRTCTIPGCDKPHRARGLCATHYNQTFHPNRHANSIEDGRRRRERERSDPAKIAKERARQRRKRERARDLAALERRVILHEVRVYIAAQPRTFTRTCDWCGATYTATRDRHAYCGETCRRRAKRMRRRAREANATGTYTWVEVTGVHRSIGGVCGYCWQPLANADVQPDHVLALSRGGCNSITNILPSCPQCNGEKRDLTLNEWRNERLRRGREPREVHPKATHLTTPGAKG